VPIVTIQALSGDRSDQEHAQMLALLQIAALLAPVNLMALLKAVVERTTESLYCCF